MTASLLPNAEQVFLDNNGLPLSLGKVYFYIPNTSTLKNTWQDPTQLILNTNPIILDAAGRAIIYGSGEYRQVVYDANNNLIWDQLTSDLIAAIQSSVALFCGTSTGTANAQVVSPSPAVTVINTGQQFSFFAGLTNASAMTLTINAITHNVKVGAASTVLRNVVAGMATLVEFDGTNFQLINPQPTYSLPAPGASGNILESDGTNWISEAQVMTIKSVVLQQFSSSGTYTPTTGMLFCQVFAIGGGGGGGSVVANAGSTAGGGASGSSCEALFSAASIGSSQSITIGAAGTGGTAGGNGGAGGTTTFGAFLTCLGGGGGLRAPDGLASQTFIAFGGTPGGISTGGNINNNGDPGTLGVGTDDSPQGMGGNGGGNGGQGGNNAAGANSLNFGGGGGGAGTAANTARNGGNGAKGYVKIIEFCSQ